jgi:hypothetical protein
MASDILAGKLAMDPRGMVNTIKAMCFKCDPSKVTNEQLAAYCVVANDLGINPLITGMLYAYPTTGGGIVPMVGPDAVFKMLGAHPDYEGLTTEEHEDTAGNVVAVTAYLHRKGKLPAIYKARLSEWFMPSNPNWKARPVHMLRLRAIKHAAREIIHGIPMDREELEMIKAVETELIPKEQARAAQSKLAALPPAHAPEPTPQEPETAIDDLLDLAPSGVDS